MDILDKLVKTIEYMGKSHDFNESTSMLYVFDAINEIKELRTKLAEREKFVPNLDFITNQHLKDLARFNETAEDDNSYDLPKIKMISLAKAGLVAHTSRGIYMITDFGESMLAAAPINASLNEG